MLYRIDAKLEHQSELATLNRELGRYQSEMESAQRSIQSMVENDQLTLAYVGSMRNYWRQILAIEEDERMKTLIESMLTEQLALIAPTGDAP